jgi:hypothetical protein
VRLASPIGSAAGGSVNLSTSLSNVAKLAADPKFVWIFNANCDGTIIYNDPVQQSILPKTVKSCLAEQGTYVSALANATNNGLLIKIICILYSKKLDFRKLFLHYTGAVKFAEQLSSTLLLKYQVKMLKKSIFFFLEENEEMDLFATLNVATFSGC